MTAVCITVHKLCFYKNYWQKIQNIAFQHLVQILLFMHLCKSKITALPSIKLLQIYDGAYKRWIQSVFFKGPLYLQPNKITHSCTLYDPTVPTSTYSKVCITEGVLSKVTSGLCSENNLNLFGLQNCDGSSTRFLTFLLLVLTKNQMWRNIYLKMWKPKKKCQCELSSK